MTLAAYMRDLQVFQNMIKPGAKAHLRQEVERVIGETLRASSPPPSFRINIGGRYVDRWVDPTDDSPIWVEFDHRKEVVQRTLTELHLEAPRVSGEYERNFVLFVNGTASDISQIRPGTDVWITNISHYARRLEVGKKADGRPFVVQTAPGMVERVAMKMVRKRFRRIATVSFGYCDISEPWIIRGRMAGTSYVDNKGLVRFRAATRDRKPGEAVRYPTIFIRQVNYEF